MAAREGKKLLRRHTCPFFLTTSFVPDKNKKIQWIFHARIELLFNCKYSDGKSCAKKIYKRYRKGLSEIQEPASKQNCLITTSSVNQAERIVTCKTISISSVILIRGMWLDVSVRDTSDNKISVGWQMRAWLWNECGGVGGNRRLPVYLFCPAGMDITYSSRKHNICNFMFLYVPLNWIFILNFSLHSFFQVIILYLFFKC